MTKEKEKEKPSQQKVEENEELKELRKKVQFLQDKNTQLQDRLQKHSKEECKFEHTSVNCDICKTKPIIGIRYKCCICHNFEICDACEQKGQHHHHPLIKLRNKDFEIEQKTKNDDSSVIEFNPKNKKTKEQKEEKSHPFEEFMFHGP